MSDTAIIYSGATGLPAALKDAYFTLYSSPVGNYVYKYHLMALEGTLEIPNNTTDLGSQLGQSLLTYIPYVDTLDLSDCTYLTGVLNLSGMSNLAHINTVGTNLGVNFGTGSNIYSMHLGRPTSITIENPTLINYDNISSRVTVDSYGELESLVIKNVPLNGSYNLFDRITKVFIYGGYIIPGLIIKDDGTDGEINVDNNKYSTSYIPVTSGDTITMVKTPSGDSGNVFFYDSNKDFISRTYVWWSDSNNVSVPNNAAYIRLYCNNGWRWNITSSTTGNLVFKYV
jgi:hypothetical protein